MVRPLRAVAPQALIPQGQGVLPRSRVQVCKPLSRCQCGLEESPYFGALGVLAVTPDNQADLHRVTGQADRASLNNASVRSLACAADGASKASR